MMYIVTICAYERGTAAVGLVWKVYECPPLLYIISDTGLVDVNIHNEECSYGLGLQINLLSLCGFFDTKIKLTHALSVDFKISGI